MKIQKHGLNTVTILNSPCFEFQHRTQHALPIISITSVLSNLSPAGKIIPNAVLPTNDFLPSSVGRELSNCRTDPRVLSAGRDSAPLAHLAIVMLTLYPHPPHHPQTNPLIHSSRIIVRFSDKFYCSLSTRQSEQPLALFVLLHFRLLHHPILRKWRRVRLKLSTYTHSTYMTNTIIFTNSVDFLAQHSIIKFQHVIKKGLLPPKRCVV